MKKSILNKLLSLLLVLGSTGIAFAQEPDDDVNRKNPPGTKFRMLFNNDFFVPIMMSNNAQRQAFRGLIGVNASFNVMLFKNFYVGPIAKYTVFQSRSANDYKLKNRDLLQQNIFAGLNIGYLINTNSPKVGFMPNLNVGYSYIKFSNITAGLDKDVYPNQSNTFITGAVTFNPNITLYLYMDEDKTGAVGFNIGATVMLNEFKKTSIAIEQEPYFADPSNPIPDNGITSSFQIGITFMQKFRKIKR